MRIDSSGNLGLGTASPNGKLDVTSTSAGANTNTLFLNNLSSNASTSTSLVFGVSTAPTIRNATIQAINAGGNAINLAFLTSDGDAPAERMRITSAGNVSIGSSSPLAKLYVVGSAAANSIMTETSAFFGQSNGLYIGSDGTDTLLGVGNSGTKLSLLSRSAGVFSKALTVNSDQTITFNGYGAGTLSTNGSGLISASDGRYKTKTRLIENGIQKIIQLQPTYYKWNENSPFASEYEELGFIAQEVAVVIPEASPENDNDKKYRNYHDRAILATLVKAIQEQQALIENLTTRLNALEGN